MYRMETIPEYVRAKQVHDRIKYLGKSQSKLKLLIGTVSTSKINRGRNYMRNVYDYAEKYKNMGGPFDTELWAHLPDNINHECLKIIGNGPAVSMPKDGKDLIELCERKTMGDENNKYEIDADDLKLTEQLIDVLGKLNKEISHEMYGGRYIKFKLRKLSVYTQGAEMKTKVFEPEDSHVGTLILELPYEYEGGEFMLGKEEIYTKNKWVAFYLKIPHSIKEVKSGHRVAIIFDIMVDDMCGTPNMTFEKYTTNTLVINTGKSILSELYERDIGLILSPDYFAKEWGNNVYKGPEVCLFEYIKNSCEIVDILPVILRQETTRESYQNHTSINVYRYTEKDMVTMAQNSSSHEFEPLKYQNLLFYDMGFYTNRKKYNNEERPRYYMVAILTKKIIILTEEMSKLMGVKMGGEINRNEIIPNIKKYIKKNNLETRGCQPNKYIKLNGILSKITNRCRSTVSLMDSAFWGEISFSNLERRGHIRLSK